MLTVAPIVASDEAIALRILGQNPNPVLQLSLSAEVVYANPAAENLLHVLTIVEGQCSRCYLLDLVRQVPSATTQEVALAGRYFLLTIVSGPSGYTLYLTDVTERHKAEKRQAAERDFFETVLYHLPTGVAIFDVKHRFQYLNPCAIRNDEIREWIIGKDNFEYCTHFNHPKSLATRRQEMFEYAVEHGTEVSWEETFHKPTGPRHWLRLYTPVFGSEGKLRLVVGSSVDITERYLAEQTIQRARQEAEAAVQVRETFLANMSHEIRTPMNGVLGMASLLSRTTLDLQQQEYVSIIRNSGSHLLSILNDILDMAKISAGKLELEHTVFNLPDTVRAVTQLLAFRAAEKNIEFELLLPEQPLPLVLGDPHRLSQVLLNLLSNAIKFTTQGYAKLYCRLKAGTPETLTVNFQVTDTGIGVALDKQEAIFESFNQAYADTTRHFGGTGLGLAISSSLVEQLGGHLLLCSRPGEGSTFGFTLPFALAGTENYPAETPVTTLAMAEQVKGWRVLLVEDHDVNRQLAQLVLEQYDIIVDAAASGVEALNLFESTYYNVVLMDIQMPDMSGLDVTTAMRRHHDLVRAHTPIIALTANILRSDNEKYLAAGMNDCLAKPFEEEELLGKMLAVHEARTIPAAPLFNLTGLYQIAHGKPAFVRRILESFASSTPNLVARLQHSLSSTNWMEIAACAHQLKPVLKLLQVDKLVQAICTLEDNSTANTERRASAQLLLESLPVLVDTLRQQINNLPPLVANGTTPQSLAPGRMRASA
ncbi:response regulator [Hymenobacter tibetensis]|uniref:histidine kinase n=1 Tax=Hymenobacter tibetensis TaxID=497967 RepID=A0ABY4D1S9_9BACT|nr:response regulator [Hymenobacter tibetensis]UOG73913.1 response regulator [Hymenobacter tibetensis]